MNHFTQVQAIYDINSSWSLLGFYGVGVTFNDDVLSNDSVTENADAVGLGFRYNLSQTYDIRIGLDVATSFDESVVYFAVGSGL
ncbi:hypothetical protein TW81_11130 [Vibrio galatheae]|uniref:Outer membrane protein beta-barrel domain-containing protein n=1 Tax=Vibrio galatheae TaxID=579748 RepID=A0A0F4NIJ6_9VIBR|nr:hypothetical protein [Vibrio galatheae]KJY82769.1 hypothetical protein TW81_11130 [Vibrio galatheae]